jgi:hypothetical protein
MSRIALTAATAALLIGSFWAPAPGLAAATGVGPNHLFPDGTKGFAFDTTGGILDPEVLVGFNPQPDPAGFGGSQYTPDGGGVRISTPASATGYEFVVSFLGFGGGHEATPMAPNRDGVTGDSFMIGGKTFDVTLAFSGPSAEVDWAAFNPQPDPPGLWFGSTFTFGAVADPTAMIQITEDGAPLSMSLAAPEPSAWALMIIGLGGVGLIARVRRRPLAPI